MKKPEKSLGHKLPLFVNGLDDYLRRFPTQFISISSFEGKKGGDDSVIRSAVNHDMYLQKVQKSTVSAFDEKQCFRNQIESSPCNCYYRMDFFIFLNRKKFIKKINVKKNQESSETKVN